MSFRLKKAGPVEIEVDGGLTSVAIPGLIVRVGGGLAVVDGSVKNSYDVAVARPRKFDEGRVLAAARDLFWSTGYAGTTIDAVAAATGLGKGSLYGAYGGKRELFHRVFEEYCTSVATTVERELAGSDEGALERLTTLFLATASASADPAHRGCFLAKGVAELTEHDEVVLERSRQTLEGVRSTMAADIEACQRHGDIDPAADAQQLAGLLLTVYRGLEALGKAGIGEAELRSAAETALRQLPRPA